MVKPAQRGTHPSLRNNLKSWSTPNKWINPRKFARSVYRGSLRIYHRFLPIYSYLVSLVQFIRRIVARISSIWWNVWRDLNKWLKKKKIILSFTTMISWKIGMKNRIEMNERERVLKRKVGWFVNDLTIGTILASHEFSIGMFDRISRQKIRPFDRNSFKQHAFKSCAYIFRIIRDSCKYYIFLNTHHPSATTYAKISFSPFLTGLTNPFKMARFRGR